jgi:hypothetical protein
MDRLERFYKIDRLLWAFPFFQMRHHRRHLGLELVTDEVVADLQAIREGRRRRWMRWRRCRTISSRTWCGSRAWPAPSGLGLADREISASKE